MFRYLALVWEGEDAAQRDAAALIARRITANLAGWELAFDADGIAVFCTGVGQANGYTLLYDNAGIVVGTIFERVAGEPDERPRRAAFDERNSSRVIESEGRVLCTEYWGRYVAFLIGKSRGRKYVFRDPVGDIPCWSIGFRGVRVLFSELEDCAQLNLTRFSVNWDHMAVRILGVNIWKDESALNEVDTLRAGECIAYAGGRVARRMHWNSLDVARSGVIEDADKAATLLRWTTRTCVDAWASCYRSVLHELSGGLDSSIVLGCLARNQYGTRVACLNLRTRDPDSDERQYARLATDQAGVPLIERERRPTIALERIQQVPRTVGPVNVVLRSLEVQPLVREVSREQDAEAIFTGDGGDMLFFRGRTELAVADYVFKHGLRRGVIPLACDVALLSQLSVWKLLGGALKHRLVRREFDLLSLLLDARTLIVRDSSASAAQDSELISYWRHATDIAPGKLMHAFSVTRPFLFRDPLAEAGDPEHVNPLLSQPIVELCLRIPTYLQVYGGYDRALARRAFMNEVPREIIMRLWKEGDRKSVV